jgi:hypothetical protein
MFIELGNVCNLECPTCGPRSSTRWYTLNRRLNEEYGLGLDSSGLRYSWYQREEIISELKAYLGGVCIVQFAGGEPLLNPVHLGLLRHCIESGVAGRIELKYNTNGTVLPGGLDALWRHFRRIVVYVSCDGHDQASVYYLRYPASLAAMLSNARRIREWGLNGLELGILATINCVNIFYLPELDRMATANDLKFVAAPVDHALLDPRVLPSGVKEVVRDKLTRASFSSCRVHHEARALMNSMMSEDWSGRCPAMRTFLDQLDSVRRTSFSAAFPEFAEVLAHYSSSITA